MGDAFLQGAGAATSLLIGALIALRVHMSLRVLGVVMAFGAGLLISSIAYELVGEAFRTSAGSGGLGLGLVAGAVTFFAGDMCIERMGGSGRKKADRNTAVEGTAVSSSALAIVLGTVLDGVPESLVLGITTIPGTNPSAALIISVFVSNLPEAIASTTGLRASGWRVSRLLLMWTGIVVLSGLAAAAGFAAIDSASPAFVAFVLAYAGGALLTMLCDTMIPEAYQHAGPLTGLVTTAGFGGGFALAAVG